MKTYVPKKGDFIAVTFDPQSGHEQKGRRPALTTTDRGYPFHVAVTENPHVTGFVMVEQVKSIDYRARQAKTIGRASEDLLDEVLSILDACIY